MINGVNSAEGIVTAIDYVIGNYQEIISNKKNKHNFYLKNSKFEFGLLLFFI